MANSWGNYVVEGRPSNTLAKKLKLLKENIKLWDERC